MFFDFLFSIQSIEFDILFFNQKFMNDFLDFFFSSFFYIYKFFYNIFINSMYFFIRFVLVGFIQYINTIFASKSLKFFYGIKNKIRDIFIHYNNTIIKVRKRYAMYFRFGKFKIFKSMFYLSFLVLLVYIWQNRNLYRYNFIIKYYFYYLLTFMFLSWILYGLIDNWFISGLLALFISFSYIYLTLK